MNRLLVRFLENSILAVCFFLAIDSLPIPLNKMFNKINNNYLFMVYKFFEKKK